MSFLSFVKMLSESRGDIFLKGSPAQIITSNKEFIEKFSRMKAGDIKTDDLNQIALIGISIHKATSTDERFYDMMKRKWISSRSDPKKSPGMFSWVNIQRLCNMHGVYSKGLGTSFATNRHEAVNKIMWKLIGKWEPRVTASDEESKAYWADLGSDPPNIDTYQIKPL